MNRPTYAKVWKHSWRGTWQVQVHSLGAVHTSEYSDWNHAITRAAELVKFHRELAKYYDRGRNVGVVAEVIPFPTYKPHRGTPWS